MAHDFHVIRCFKCQTFQVQQVKKVNKWSCKLCGEKQSLLKEFGRGSGADCRRHVQKLNAMRGEVMGKQDHQAWSLWDQVEEDRNDQVNQNHISRWSKYMGTSEEADPQEDNVLTDRQELHGLNTSDGKRKMICTPEQSKCSGPNPDTLKAPAGLNQSGSPSLRTKSLDWTSLPNQNQCHLPSKKYNLKTGQVSKWARFLCSDCPVQEEGPSGSADQSCHDTEGSQHLLCVSSMFDGGENFSFE